MRFFCLSLFCSFAALSLEAEIVDYKSDILPIMKERCWDCHSNETKVKGNLALDDFEEVRDYQIGKYNIIRPGNPEESNFVERLRLDSNHTDFMPRKEAALPEDEILKIEEWIKQGAVIDAANPVEEEAEWVSKGNGSSSGSPSAEFLNWTNRAGKTIQARFHSASADQVTIITKDGKSFKIPLASLDAKSVEQAKKLLGQ